MSSLMLLIGGMAIVTYLSRVAPFLLLPTKGLPRRVERFLACVPPAAIGALIFPDVLNGPEGYRHAALLAVVVASLFATRSRALWITVGGAIVVTWLAIHLGLV